MKNVNLVRVISTPLLLDDGNPWYLPVDQFPVSNKGLYKDDGFPCNEIDILDRYSTSKIVDDDLIKIVAKRLDNMPTSDSADDGLSIEDKIRVLRPAWCQTPSEYAAYSERVISYMESLNKNTDLVSDDSVSKTDDVSVVSTDSSTDSSVSD